MKVAIYARYSSENQRDASIADQFRVCREFAQRQGWQIAARVLGPCHLGRDAHAPWLPGDDARSAPEEVRHRHGRSARSLQPRPGRHRRAVQAADVRRRQHRHAGRRRHHAPAHRPQGDDECAVPEGAGREDATRPAWSRRSGKAGGGLSYGYRVVRRFENGVVTTGEREIVPEEAAVVRRIFKDYLAGASPKQIAKTLNAEGVRGPQGALWSPSTIHGNPKRGNGILHNELYIGRLVWNRQRFLKDPDTGKRVARMNPPSEWITKDVPELRIVDDELWNGVQARYAQCAAQVEVGGRMASASTSSVGRSTCSPG